MNITIEPVSKKNMWEIYDFEKENKDYFRLIGMGRPEYYFEKYSFRRIIRSCIKEWKADISYMFVVRNSEDEIVGRINFYDIERGDYQVCMLGYRIGQRHQQKGYASRGVNLALKEMFENHHFRRIEANVAVDNLASQRVIEKNGFRKIGVSNEHMRVNNQWKDFVLYELLAKNYIPKV